MKKRHILLLLPLVLIITGCPFLNRLPVWTLIPDLVRNIGQAVNFNLLTYCTDPDGDPLTFSIVSGPGTIVGSNYTWTVAGPIGPRVITVRVSDGKGHSETSFTITVKGPPNVPSNPSPANNAINQNYPNVTLSWTGGDPDGDTVTYDLYFGTASNPPLYQTGLSYTTYGKSGLQSYTKYYWKIVAKDGVNTTTGPIWNFTTKPYEIVNDNFESRPTGILSAGTLPWATYSFGGTSYSYISASFGLNGSKGLTFIDETVAGFSSIRRSISSLKKGSVEFYLRVSSGGHFGFRNGPVWAPYILTGDMGSGFGLYSYNVNTAAFTKIYNLLANVWYKIFIEFDFNAGQNYFKVYVDNVLRRTETLTGTFAVTELMFTTFVDKVCNWADMDNVVIKALQSNYTTTGETSLEAFDTEPLSTDQ